MSLALYRKYRPKNLDELVGQEENVMILKNAAKMDRFAHAYLFFGSRGTGKTTTARLIAKLLNCEKRHGDTKFAKTGEPCNECRSCKEIDSNSSIDVVEIDAASNRGIDEIRDLKENITTAPTGGHYRVYIIDEVHMLTGAAFNALLKTLEEPPMHAVFILATTEYEKLPATITSRTQKFTFRKLTNKVVLEKLNTIVKAEEIEIEPSALELIAAAGEGSLRDSESILDQVASVGKKITLQDVERMTGRIGLKKVELLAELILKKDSAGALKEIGLLHEEGHNIIQVTRDLIHYLRKALSLKLSPELKDTFKMEHTEEEISKLKKVGELLNEESGVRIIRSLIRAYSEMRYSPFAMIPLEVALIEFASEK